jgi:hypothetical protein
VSIVRPPKTIDVDADDGSTYRYCLAEWVQAGPSAVYTFLYPVQRHMGITAEEPSCGSRTTASRSACSASSAAHFRPRRAVRLSGPLRSAPRSVQRNLAGKNFLHSLVDAHLGGA